MIAIAIDAESSSFLALLKAIRNTLAHGSRGSLTTFNLACRQQAVVGSSDGLVGASNRYLVRDQNDVRELGVYLRALKPGPNGHRRLEIIHNRLIEVSDKLRTS